MINVFPIIDISQDLWQDPSTKRWPGCMSLLTDSMLLEPPVLIIHNAHAKALTTNLDNQVGLYRCKCHFYCILFKYCVDGRVCQVTFSTNQNSKGAHWQHERLIEVFSSLKKGFLRMLLIPSRLHWTNNCL